MFVFSYSLKIENAFFIRKSIYRSKIDQNDEIGVWLVVGCKFVLSTVFHEKKTKIELVKNRQYNSILLKGQFVNDMGC